MGRSQNPAPALGCHLGQSTYPDTVPLCGPYLPNKEWPQDFFKWNAFWFFFFSPWYPMYHLKKVGIFIYIFIFLYLFIYYYLLLLPMLYIG